MKNNILLIMIFVLMVWPPEGGNSQKNDRSKVAVSGFANRKKTKLAPAPSVKKITESVQPGIDSLKELYNSRSRAAQLEKQVELLRQQLQDSIAAAAKFRARVAGNTRAFSKRIAEIKLRAATDSTDRAMDDSLSNALDKTLFRIGRDTVYLPLQLYIPVYAKKKGIWPFRKTWYDTAKTFHHAR